MINKCIIFTSKTCKDCFALEAKYQQLEAEFKMITFEYIDVIDNPRLGQLHNIMTVPSLELYADDELIAEFKHGQNKQYQHIVNFIRLYVELTKEKRWLYQHITTRKMM